MDGPSAPGSGSDPSKRPSTPDRSGAADGSDVSCDGVTLPAEGGAEEARGRIVRFVRRAVDSAEASGVVVEMDGRVDSTVTAALAVEALGAERVYGLVLPSTKIGAPLARDAEALAGALEVAHDTVHLRPLVARLDSATGDRFGRGDDPVAAHNAVARLRMTLSYLAADTMDYLVCGAANRTDRLLGRVVAHGDGAADLFPIGHLYRTDVEALAASLNVPEFVARDDRGGRRLPGERGESGPGAPDAVVDRVLHLRVDEGLGSEAIAGGTGIDPEVVAAVLARYERTARSERFPRRLDPHGTGD